MAALLSVFHPVPPVIRRRAKELLDAIRDAAKSALGAGAAPSSSMVETSAPEMSTTMVVDEANAAVVEESYATSSSKSTQSLWSIGE